MTRKERIYNKYGGLCAYSGTQLAPDWQIDHINPVRRNKDGSMLFPDDDNEENMVPVQRLINHYKHSLSLNHFRTWFLADLHLRLGKLPKNPRTTKGLKRKMYMEAIAAYFGITPEKPFSGKFYFETHEARN